MGRETRDRPLYRRSNGEGIRLIEIYPGDWDDQIDCQLHFVPLDESPEYVALSYAWGDQSTPSVEIRVNGRSHMIPQSLFTALRRLRDFEAIGNDGASAPAVYFNQSDPLQQSPVLQLNLRKFRLWADALCINQKDDEDKQNQIPLMRQIYRHAADVFVWLGENDTQDEPLLMELSEVLHRTEPMDGFIGTGGAGIVDHFKVFEWQIEVAENLLLRPWFTRLWVVQEIALPTRKSPCFFAGRNYYSLRSISSLSWSLEQLKGTTLTPVLWVAQLLRERNSLVVLPEPSAHHPWDISTATGAQGFDLSAFDFRQRLLIIQSLSRGFRASRLHDYIYAVLGLCGPGALPAILAPDYGKPFSEVCRDYSMAIIQETGRLRLLARQKNSLEGVPSWVPDFSADSTDRLRIFLAESQSAKQTKFSVDRSKMLIDAHEVGACAIIGSTNKRGGRTQILSELTAFLQRTAASSLSTYDDVLTRYAIQCASSVWDYWEHQLNSKGISYDVVLAVAITFINDLAWPGHPNDTDQFHFVSQKIIDELVEAAPISTADGTLLFIHRKDASPQYGDIVVVPVDSPFAWLLRAQEHDSTYRLISTCSFRQIGTGDYWSPIQEDFAASRGLKSFAIV